MTVTTATNFRNNIFKYLSSCTKYYDPIYVTHKEGTCVLISQEDYESLLETIELNGIPGMRDSILEARNTPRDERLSDEEVRGNVQANLLEAS